MSNCKINIKFEFRDFQNHRNNILHGNFGQSIEKRIFAMADGGHFGFLPTTNFLHRIFRETPLQFPFKTFEEKKKTEKGTFALHGHESSPNDPTTLPLIVYALLRTTGVMKNLSHRKIIPTCSSAG